MAYTISNPPEWLKGLPQGAVRIGVEVYNEVLAKSKDEERARKAAWSAVKAKYEQGGDGAWQAREGVEGGDRGSVIHFRAGQADDSGLTWEAVLIAPGLSISSPRFYWSEEVLEAAAAGNIFNGVDINAYELTVDFFSHLPIPNVGLLEDVKRYLSARKVGWIEKTWYEAGAGIKAVIRIIPEQRWVADTLRHGTQAGSDVFGLSIDSRVKGFEVLVDDWTVVWVTQIISASSVDVVTRPAAGGRFLRAVAGLQKEEREMDRDKLIGLIKEKRPELLQGKDVAALNEDEVLALARQAMTPEPPESRAAQGLPGITPEQVDQRIKEAIKETETRAACAVALTNSLSESGLPDLTRAKIRTAYSGRIFEQAELDKAIQDEKDYIAKLASAYPQVPAWGDQSRASGGIGQRDKIAMAVDQVFGLTGTDIAQLSTLRCLDGQPFFSGMRAAQDYDALKGVPLPGGLRELYMMLTGDTEVRGHFNRDLLPADLRAAQDINSGTFAFVLGNTLGRRLVKDYLAVDFGESLLISIRKSVKDFRTQEAVLIGYFGDLSPVDPEVADYNEIAPVTDEESTYAILQRGNILTITRRTIINDDISVIQRLVSRLGRAARRTHAKYVWDFFTANANCSDGTAWFTVPHGNLGAAALSFATAIIGYTALATMTEKDSGERIGLLDDPSIKPNLIYPVNVMQTGESIANDEAYYTANDLTTKTRNPLRGKVVPRKISLLNDVNDWGLLLPPEVVDMVEMGYLNGRQEPEMFLADSPQAEQVFVADKVRYKIRHEYAGAVIDFRSGYKAEVA